jgi:phosphatidylserine/phosphatidylglycerophosphate/cardiolipin synthase-like enzyme
MSHEDALPLFTGGVGSLLCDEAYLDYLHAVLPKARRRVWVSQFLIGLDPDSDTDGLVRGLCHELGRQAWKGLDVRVLLSPFLAGEPAYQLNAPAREFLGARGVRVRTYRAPEHSRRDGLHSKLVLLDGDRAVVGSHNWSSGAFCANREMSVAVRSVDVTRRLDMTFRRLWEAADA